MKANTLKAGATITGANRIRGQRRQAGFSLIELMVVIVIIAVLILAVARAVNGSTDEPRAQMLVKTATNFTSNWTLITSKCSVSQTVAGSAIPVSGKNALDVIIEGDSAVAPAYKECYAKSSARALREVANKNGAGWQVESFPVTLTGGGPSSKLIVTYQRVPDEVVLKMAQGFTTNLTALATSDTTNDVLQYSAAAANLRSVMVRLD
ncbi:prepilin-type N-terminal cleavage/methylation domain-containing protein [Stenotrophomonas sp. STK17_22]|uniref:prepilin-type N-terminal cleavage/methylation domain-containing protein n=1 Tax=Stenotrophomonas sp. STK17_22 TaxID=3455201 RepID=UPI003F820EE4